MEQTVDSDVVESEIDQLLNDFDESLSLTPRNLSLAKATESLTGIINLICDKYYDYIDLICNTCAKRELCEKFYLVYPMNVDKNEIINNEIVELIQEIVLNFSNRPNDFPESVVSSGIFNSLVDVFLDVDSSEDIDNPKIKAFFFRSVVIINNIARNRCQKIEYKIQEIKNALEKYMKSNCDDELGVNLRVSSILTLSYLLDDSMVDQLDDGVGAIKKVIEHIRSIIENDKRSGGFTLEELLHGLMSLWRNDKMKIKIEEEEGIHLLKKVLNIKISKMNVGSNDIVNDEITKLIQTIVINLSDYSNDFAQSVVSSGIFNSLVDVFLQVDSPGNIDDPGTKEFLLRSVVIIKNISRNRCQKIKYKIQEIKNALEKYMKSNCDDKLGVNSILTLSYLLDDSEVDQLDEGVGVIKKVIEHIRSIIENDKRSGGFTLKELLHGLMRLSRNEKMKIKIEEGGIDLLIKIIKNEKDDEVKSALGTIDNLCRKYIIKQKLKDNCEFIDTLYRRAGKGPSEIKKQCESILLEIQDKTRYSENSSRYMMAVLL